MARPGPGDNEGSPVQDATSVLDLRNKIEMLNGTVGLGFIFVGRANSDGTPAAEGVEVSELASRGRAYAAGVRTGDKLLTINGEDARGATFRQAADIMGAQGKHVILRLRGPAGDRTVRLTREQSPPASEL